MRPCDEVKAARIALGMTQDEFAKELCLSSKDTIYRYEAGKRIPNGAVMLLIRHVLAKKGTTGKRK